VWIKERVDLSRFAGQQVWLRFEYVTDGGINGEGFLVDDLSIPQIGYSSDFEVDDGGWLAQGFARVQNSLPQTFRVALIKPGIGSTTVQKFSLEGNNSLTVPLQLSWGERAILVVSGTTRYTRQKASYRFSLLPSD
jgi:hypothetical protein